MFFVHEWKVESVLPLLYKEIFLFQTPLTLQHSVKTKQAFLDLVSSGVILDLK